jgi:aspartate carbamoyltransferase regulatory subunit
MRHPYDGSVQWAADVSKLPVINGGDGKNWHPTQALLDLFTIKEIMGTLDNLKIGLSGDLKYGRTVHSLPLALSKYKNIELHIGSSDLLMMPNEILQEVKNKGVKVFTYNNIIDILKNCDVHYHTRPQFNLMKQDPNAPNEEVILNELEKWRITKKIIDQLNNIPFIMHPLPIDSIVSEIDLEIAFLPQQKFLIQAESGIFLRKAILTKMLKDKDYILFDGDISNLSKFYGKNIIEKTFKNFDLNSKSKLNPGEIKPIVNGYVIDRLEPYTDKKIIEKLNLPYKGIMTTSKITNSKNGELKSILFITDYELSDKEMKTIARISNNATFNQIKNGKIIKKFVYPTCNNNNCVSNYINEEVPIRFQLNSNNKVECRYCRTLNDLNISKLTEEDKLNFINNLEKREF